MQCLRSRHHFHSTLCRYLKSFSISASSAAATDLPQDFAFFPKFFNLAEQRTLLRAALQKLDSTESRSVRRRRKELLSSRLSQRPQTSESSIMDDFLPDDLYTFEEGHFDGVIKRFRETHVSSWGDLDTEALQAVFNRLRALYPTKGDTQMHILHLASDGEILPHVDNIGASGSWILGVSLGSERILHLERAGPTDSAASQINVVDLLLPSGSVYVQKWVFSKWTVSFTN
ncbi:hypothetical protein EW146_g5740 [Bondarzewia mesenterica]|uniref:Alpha-ketoglutarate-dependent dioxygenase AlkB-like domain-containing protein n=1 Tax=Bondarzewia mesenterica TaxID=1095465 RepID=A0A4S4LSF3_9AGAM|nr:hypothetical protein EW146_g5740 [Bondarzewia mesenterica]